MITYVNTVLVSNLTSENVITTLSAYNGASISDAGKFVVITVDEKPYNSDSEFPVVSSSTAANYDRIKVGLITNKTCVQVNPNTGETSVKPVIKWSNIISSDSIKSYTNHDYEDSSEDKAYIDFSSLTDIVGVSNSAPAGKRIIVRLTFKDLPTRYRNWTESYEYVTVEGDTKASIADNITKLINKQYKRARVIATNGTVSLTETLDGFSVSFVAKTNEALTGIQLEAMPYDDDEAADTINWANKVRFNVNVYWTDPAADGWESTNKHFPTGAKIAKVPGKRYIADAKLVRDREAQAMGYQGILNRGEGTWPIIKPDMQTNINNKYSATTLEFERMYRTADDLQRRTKECIELYAAYTPAVADPETPAANGLTGIRAILDAFVQG